MKSSSRAGQWQELALKCHSGWRLSQEGSLQTYEIRIHNDDTSTKLVIEQQFLNDQDAIRSVQHFGEPNSFEVWRGLTRVYAGALRQHPKSSSPSQRSAA